MKESFEYLMTFHESDYKMIIEGLESLKSKDLAGELMSGLFESMLINPDKMDPIQRMKYEDKKKKEDEEKKNKEKEKEELKNRIDVLKAKFILLQEARKVEDFKKTSKKIS